MAQPGLPYDDRDGWIWLDGEFVAWRDAKVHVLTHALHYASSVFEGARIYGGEVFKLTDHTKRLKRSAEILDFELPYSVEEIDRACKETVSRNGLGEGVVYLQLTRGAAERDFLPPPDLQPTLLLFTQPKMILASPAAKRGIAIATMPDLRWARRDIKSTMLLTQVLAKRAAQAAGADDAWLVEDGFVTEGASATALIVTQEGVLVTRPDSQAILPGCTRAAVGALAEQDGVRVEERPFTVAEAQGAREAMITSASTFVLPVVRIDGVDVGDGRPGPVACRLRHLYIAAARSA